MKAHVGDWIRFSNEGQLAIGVVEYIREPTYYEGLANRGLVLITSNGTLRESEVLEIRRVMVVE